jgi:hypothetical protein
MITNNIVAGSCDDNEAERALELAQDAGLEYEAAKQAIYDWVFIKD